MIGLVTTRNVFLLLSAVALSLCGQSSDIQPASSYIGIVKASERMAVTPRITGTIWRQCFEEDAVVRKGQTLFEIEDTVCKANLAAAEAARDELKANLAFAEKEVDLRVGEVVSACGETASMRPPPRADD